MSDGYTYPEFEGFSNSTIDILITIGDFVYSVTEVSQELQIYFVLIGMLVNIFHLLVLTRASMRTNSVNVIMTGIAVCDFFNCISLIYTYYPSFTFVDDCWTSHNYTFEYLGAWNMTINDVLRRLCAWLGIALASIRYLVIKYYYNPRFQKLTKPWFGLKTVLFLLIFSSCISSFYYSHMFVVKAWDWKPDKSCAGYSVNYSEPSYVIQLDASFYTDYFLNFENFMIFDGAIKVIVFSVILILCRSLSDNSCSDVSNFNVFISSRITSC